MEGVVNADALLAGARVGNGYLLYTSPLTLFLKRHLIASLRN
jgi:hypothetical protein